MLKEENHLQAVMFDFDLTLANSTRAATACIAHALKKLGFDSVPQDAVRKTIGLSLEATLEILTGNTTPSVQAQFKELFLLHADRVMVAQTDFLEGVPSALAALRAQGLRLAIVSTKFRYRIQAILDRHEAGGLFEVVVGGEDTAAHKPDPEGLERALVAMGVNRTQAVYVGDHLVDAQAAMKASIPFVPVLTGATRRDDFLGLPHVNILRSVSDLPSFLSEFEEWPPPGANSPPYAAPGRLT